MLVYGTLGGIVNKVVSKHEIGSLNLYENYKVYCIGVRKHNTEKVEVAYPTYVIQENDKLIFAGHNGNLEILTKL